MAKPKLEIRKKTDTELLVYADSIVTAMAGNANFTAPTPGLAAVSARIADFHTKCSDFVAKTAAARRATVEKETSRSALAAILTQLAGYVEAATEGNASKILSSGMQMKGSPGPVGTLPAPANLRATAGDREGAVNLAWPRVLGASSYEVERKLAAAAAAWQRVKSVTASRLIVPDLTPGETYVFRVRCLGAAGESPWSNEVVRRAP